MTPAQQVLAARIQARASLARPDLARRLLRAYQTLLDNLSERDLVDLIRSGQAEAVVERLANDEALERAFLDYRVGVDRAVLEAADRSAATLPAPLRGPFDILNPRVIAAAQQIDGRSYLDLRTEVRATVRQAVVEGIREGRNPREVARTLQSAVGLSPKQEAWVRNFRRELETGDRAALQRVLGRGQIRKPDGSNIWRDKHAGGKGLGTRDLAMLEGRLGSTNLTPDQIDRLSDAYRRRLLALNTEAHTRSAALNAQRAGNRAGWEDAISRGTLTTADLRRRWVAVGGPLGDGRNRAEHLLLHGTVVRWEEMYPNGELVPGESSYNCRCIEQIFVIQEATA